MTNITYKMTNGAYNLSNSVYQPYLNNYLWDDWDDNALSRPRTNQKDGSYKGQDGTIYNDARYRPDWTTQSGTPTVSSKQLVLDGSTNPDEISTTSNFTAGSFAIDFQWNTATNNPWALFGFMSEKANTNDAVYMINVDGTGTDYELRKTISGTSTLIIDSSWGGDTTLHTAKATHDANGNMELFYDGTSKGTGTDTDITNPAYLLLRNANTNAINFDNLILQ